MERAELERHLGRCLDAVDRFRDRWPEYRSDPTLEIGSDRVSAELDRLFDRLRDNYPFQHPLYAGQMLKPPHPAAILAYFTAMHINPNNHALDGGPATAAMERDAVAELARMFGWDTHLGHLTGGGTVANLEALWVGREMRPGSAVAASADAHYTHRRMCQVLDVPFVEIPVDDQGRMDVASLERELAGGSIGTVVASLGTTALGALDPVSELAALRERGDFRLHVDAAYGGFFRLIAGDGPLDVDRRSFEAAAGADSLVIDPHKHGLQPYGCGSVLFRDPAVGRFYRHDSPYTYFTSDELHLGEISLECSRPGAAAAALWLTIQCLPLRPDSGMGPVLRRCRSAALDLAERLRRSERFALIVDPALDIVTFLPRSDRFRASGVSALSTRLFEATMRDAHQPVYLSKMRIRSERLARRFPGFDADQDETAVLRSCLMKPEHAEWVPRVYESLERHLAALA